MLVNAEQLQPVFRDLGASEISEVVEMTGGSSPVFRVDLSDGKQFVLKVYPDGGPSLPGKEAFAAGLVRHLGLPVTRYLVLDESRTRLPFRFAVTNYLPGVAADAFKDHPKVAGVYRQMGVLMRRLHSVKMPSYGQIDATGIWEPVRTNAEFLRKVIGVAFGPFKDFGGDPGLADRLSRIVEDRFDAVVPHSSGPVFAHDDLHPGNVLVTETPDGSLRLSGLIDFGNARAADATFDLAKCLLLSAHLAPSSGPLILEGYGPVDHPDPEGALWYYTLLHRTILWWWLRHIGGIPAADTPSDLTDGLRAMAESA